MCEVVKLNECGVKIKTCEQHPRVSHAREKACQRKPFIVKQVCFYCTVAHLKLVAPIPMLHPPRISTSCAVSFLALHLEILTWLSGLFLHKVDQIVHLLVV